VNGLAQAAGLIAVLTSDLVIASDRARFRVPETRRGLTEPYIPRRLAATIGLARARWMIYTAEEIDAAQALAWGLVAKVVPHPELDEAVAQAIAALRRTGPQSRAHYKRMITQTLPPITLDEYLLSMRSPEALEGMRSFAEKRPPSWGQSFLPERPSLQALRQRRPPPRPGLRPQPAASHPHPPVPPSHITSETQAPWAPHAPK
jgi:enoyl-CoA hydratase/carnithine racemase